MISGIRLVSHKGTFIAPTNWWLSELSAISNLTLLSTPLENWGLLYGHLDGLPSPRVTTICDDSLFTHETVVMCVSSPKEPSQVPSSLEIQTRSA